MYIPVIPIYPTPISVWKLQLHNLICFLRWLYAIKVHKSLFTQSLWDIWNAGIFWLIFSQSNAFSLHFFK